MMTTKRLLTRQKKYSLTSILGAEIINPAEIVLPEICDWEDYMVICLKLLDKATHIYMLDNWVHSRGACSEHLYALENGIDVLWPEGSPYR